MLRNDNWGHRARIGIFIVGSEAVPEAEWWAMLPPGVSVHAARVTAPAPWATWREDRSGEAPGVDLADDLARGLRQFAAMRLDTVVVGHSSSSFAGGKGWDEAVVRALAAGLDPDVTVTTNGLDTLAALDAAGVRRPYLVLPPWYDDATVASGLRYYADHGVAPAGHLRYDPGELYINGAGFAQEVAPLKAQIESSCPAAADGVLIAGTGFRCVAILAALEAALGRPVLSANQVSLWRALRAAGVRDEVAGYGRLLET